MELSVIFGLGAVLLGLVSLAAIIYFVATPRSQVSVRNLIGVGRAQLGTPSEERSRLEKDTTGTEYLRVKKATKKVASAPVVVDLDTKLFQAGIFSAEGRAEVQRQRVVIPIVLGVAGAVAGYFIGFSILFNGDLPFVLGGVGVLWGMQLPFSILDRKKKARNEEISYFLPLVIEQVAIGVSSSLDIAPCLQRVVAMADERDKHNPVTELLKYALFHVKSGVSLDEALNEIARAAGSPDLKHSFVSMAQSSRHGGEITRQLQELADSVSAQREVRIDGKIKKLELEATLPLGMIFFAFLGILLVGFFSQLTGKF